MYPFSLVRYAKKREVEKAMKNLNGLEISGHNIGE